MAGPERPYRRLPGRVWISLAGRHALWLGPDHLLSVRSLHFSEEYRRFDYGDIQALVLRPTARRAIYGGVLGGLAALLGLSALAASGPVALVPGIPGGLALLLFAVNWLRGPTCACELRTAVHAEPLPCLRRVRPARKAFGLLRERVETAQGRLTREALRARLGGEADVPAERAESAEPAGSRAGGPAGG